MKSGYVYIMFSERNGTRYYEDCGNIMTAIEREKQIKGGSRKKKLELIPNFSK